jgi:hypothetical protein
MTDAERIAIGEILALDFDEMHDEFFEVLFKDDLTALREYSRKQGVRPGTMGALQEDIIKRQRDQIDGFQKMTGCIEPISKEEYEKQAEKSKKLDSDKWYNSGWDDCKQNLEAETQLAVERALRGVGMANNKFYQETLVREAVEKARKKWAYNQRHEMGALKREKNLAIKEAVEKARVEWIKAELRAEQRAYELGSTHGVEKHCPTHGWAIDRCDTCVSEAVEKARTTWEIEDGSAVKDLVALQKQMKDKHLLSCAGCQSEKVSTVLCDSCSSLKDKRAVEKAKEEEICTECHFSKRKHGHEIKDGKRTGIDFCYIGRTETFVSEREQQAVEKARKEWEASNLRHYTEGEMSKYFDENISKHVPHLDRMLGQYIHDLENGAGMHDVLHCEDSRWPKIMDEIKFIIEKSKIERHAADRAVGVIRAFAEANMKRTCDAGAKVAYYRTRERIDNLCPNAKDAMSNNASPPLYVPPNVPPEILEHYKEEFARREREREKERDRAKEGVR